MRYKSVLLLTALLATLCPPEGSTALRSGWSGGGWHQGLTSSSSPGGRWCHKCFPVLLVGEHPSWSDTYIIDSESIEGPETSLLHWFPCGELCPEIFRSELTWGAPLCEKKKTQKTPLWRQWTRNHMAGLLSKDWESASHNDLIFIPIIWNIIF